MIIASLFVLFFATTVNCGCTKSITKIYGNSSTFCSNALVFEENFDSLNFNRWFFENSLGGGGNKEFQWYPGYNESNCFTTNGLLHLAPTTTASIFGEEFLSTAHVVIPPNQCSFSANNGCDKQGTVDNIINPIRSTRMDTRNSFSFKYGTLEIRAKMPAGDWLWPAMWLMPKASVYGGWPRSGEIDLAELRGNLNLMAPWGVNVGATQTASTLHFGPSPSLNGFSTAHYEKNSNPGYNADFHVYKLVWKSTQITFYVDNVLYGTVDAGNGFWARYPQFQNSTYTNPWSSGSIMAPFDQEFFIILNLAVGGINFFSDSYVNSPYPKPWLNTSPRAAADFWQNNSWWLPGWNLTSSDSSHLQVDYVRVYAL